MVLVDASSDSLSNVRIWAGLIVPCLQGCSWPWRAVAGMHVALRVGQELPRLKMFCSLEFARLTGVTSQSPTKELISSPIYIAMWRVRLAAVEHAVPGS